MLDVLKLPRPEQFFVTDPSEAVRSEEIVPLIKKFYTISHYLPLGGTLVNPIFQRTAANFLDDEGVSIVQSVLEQERSWIQTEKLSSDFMAFIAT